MTAPLRSRIVGHGEEPPDQLLANPHNFRRHPGEQMDALRGSLADFGWVRSVLVNKQTGHVVDGHARVEEALRQGLATVPVEYVDLTAEEERAVLLALDPITGMAIHDQTATDALVSTVLAESAARDTALREMLAGLGSTKLDPVELADPDAVPEVPEEPITKWHDVIVLGEHRLVCGDSQDPTCWDALLLGSKADFVWTDPPYGVSLEAKVAALTSTGGRNNGAFRRARAIAERASDSHIENDDLSVEELETFLRDVFALVLANTRGGACWYVAAPSNPPMLAFAKVLHEIDVWRSCIIWSKDRFVLGRADYHSQHELLFFGWTPGAAHHALEDRTQGNVWQVDRPQKSPEHPTMKPVALVRRAIENSSTQGDVVIDPFGGSGTTLIACEMLHRKARLIEISPGYCDVIVRRWEEATGQKAVRP